MTDTLVERIANAYNSELLVECLRSVYTDFRSSTTLDRFLEEMDDLNEVGQSSTLTTFKALAETLLMTLPKLKDDISRVWHFVGSILDKLPRSASEDIDKLIVAVRERIRDMIISDPPAPTDAKARASAIQVAMLAGCKFYANDFKKSGAGELFKSFPAAMIYYSLRLNNKNFTDAADLIVEQVAAGSIPMQEMVFRLPDVLDAVERHVDKRSAGNYWWRIYQGYATGNWPEGTSVQFDEQVKKRWPSYGTRPEKETTTDWSRQIELLQRENESLTRNNESLIKLVNSMDVRCAALNKDILNLSDKVNKALIRESDNQEKIALMNESIYKLVIHLDTKVELLKNDLPTESNVYAGILRNLARGDRPAQQEVGVEGQFLDALKRVLNPSNQ